MAERSSLGVIWDDLALPDLTCSFQLAIGPTKMIVSFCAVFAICALGYIMDRCISTVSVAPESIQSEYRTELDAYIGGGVKQTNAFIKKADPDQKDGVFASLWTFFTGRFHAASTRLLNLSDSNLYANVKFVLFNIWQCIQALFWAFRFHPYYSIVYFIIVFSILVFTGGAITRCAALEFSKAEKPGLFEIFNYAKENYCSFLSAPLLPLGLVGVFAFMVIALGMIGSIPRIGELLVALSFGLVLIVGFLVTLLALGALTGSLLLFPSVAYEKTTGLDSIGRAFHYVIGAPAWMFYYTFISAAMGTFFYLILRLFVFLVLILTHRLLLLGMTLVHSQEKLQRIWPKPDLLSFLNHASDSAAWSESMTSFIIRLFMLAVVGVLLSYIVSYFFCSSAVIYGLMRKKVDKVRLDQIYVHLEQATSTQ